MKVRVDLPPPIAPALRMLTAADVPEIYDVHCRVLAALPALNLVRRDTPEVFHAMLETGGAITGLMHEGEIIAYGMVRPEMDGHGEDDGDRAGFGDHIAPDESLFVLDGSAVRPDHWSRGLQRTLITARIAHARRRGADHTVCTAAPNNVPSMRNLTKEGFRIVRATKKAYGMRYLLWRPVADPAPPRPEDGEWRPARDTGGANALFARGSFAFDAIRGGDQAEAFLRFTPPADGAPWDIAKQDDAAALVDEAAEPELSAPR